jgi:hypothetical protein
MIESFLGRMSLCIKKDTFIPNHWGWGNWLAPISGYYNMNGAIYKLSAGQSIALNGNIYRISPL